jgi:tRNA threonylcarbamoyladenosine biosynthesis protein TsaB
VNILGIETATTVCGVALMRDDRIVAEQWLEERSVHAERLFGLIDQVLQEGGVDPRDLDALAISIGPGSFTGLRIGLSAAKGFHLALGKPVLAVPTLTALAQRCEGMLAAEGGHIVAALDARRDEVYCQTFAVTGGIVVPAGDVDARTVAEVVSSIPRGTVVLTGDARFKILAAIPTGDTIVQPVIADEATARCSAASVVLTGAAMLAQGQIADAGSLEPKYVKEVFLRSSH